MKKKLLRKVFALSLTLLVALALTACSPEIHIHTDGSSENAVTENTDNSTVASTEEKTENTNTDKSEVQTSVASSEEVKSESPKKEDATPSKATSSKAPSGNTISTSKAKSIALNDAGLKASEIYDYEIELDRDNGVLHYDVSFEKDGKDYDYEIDAKTGKIISVEKPNATSSEVKISKSKAKTTALNHAGVKSQNITQYEVELEKDNGVWKYEISFKSGNVEYEYTINAETGKIIKSEKDIDD